MGGRPGSPVVPRATYRLQLHGGFTFEDAAAAVPYLAALGISHAYVSPFMAARPGSSHGYDVVDHARVNPELGGDEGLDAFVETLHRHGMGLILDFVPNHMGIGADNAWWMDVLEWGGASPRAGFFDIDWNPPGPGLEGRVLLPVLGDHYGSVLERGELTLAFHPDEGSFSVHYFDQRFPLRPRDYPAILREAAELREGEGAVLLGSLAGELNEAVRARSVRDRRSRVEKGKRRLAGAAERNPEVGLAVEAALDGLNGEAGAPESMDRLDRLLEGQAFRLAYWRVAAYEINYRRFFDIDELAGLRMEDPELFEAGHRLVRSLVERGALQGIRLDHVDGLRDPTAYFRRLRGLARDAGAPHLLVLVEKILAPHEHLRWDWDVDGTTGYEFMAGVNGLFVDPAAARPLSQTYARFLGVETEFPEVALEAKRLIMRETLASELNVLANLFHRLARQSRITRDYTLTGFRTALADVVAHFRVYRTYMRGDAGAGGGGVQVAPEDRVEVESAVERARRHSRQPDTSVYDFILRVLTLELLDGPRRDYRRRDVLDAALRFQQYTGPVMAKSVEDTAFYRYHRLVALNEVGGEPEHFGTSPEEMHRANARRLADFPRCLITTATHDHKRGEDVRARLDVLSEIPREWARRVRRWARWNRGRRGTADGRPAPGRNDEYLLYQTVVGAWPLFLDSTDPSGIHALRERVAAYMLKAAREAKERTSWVAPDEEYEEALGRFVGGVLDPGNGAFLQDVHAFVEAIAPTAAVNGLARTLIKLASPGIPDTYQGTELWDLSLVDPDNRRPVDWAERREGLSSDRSWAHLVRSWRDGRVKQRIIRRALEIRRHDARLFAEGSYTPLNARGRHAARVFAFARELEDRLVVAVAPRLVHPLVKASLPLPEGWDDTILDLPGRAGAVLEDAFTGAEIEIGMDGSFSAAGALARLPVSLLLAPRGRLR
jgi:(1->4)-alpha-D-glucan 1-alpha-D-glucosylmutase